MDAQPYVVVLYLLLTSPHQTGLGQGVGLDYCGENGGGTCGVIQWSGAGVDALGLLLADHEGFLTGVTKGGEVVV